MKKEYLECAKIINTHGFDGKMKLEHYCDNAKDIKKYSVLYTKNGNEYKPVTLETCSVFKDFLVVKFKEINDESLALSLKGTVLYAKRENIPLQKGQHLIADLIGLPVFHADTLEKLGIVKDYDTSGARDFYVIETSKGQHLVPAVKEFVVRVDEETGIYIRPIPGLLDDEEKTNDEI